MVGIRRTRSIGRRLAVLVSVLLASWMLTDLAWAEKVYVQAKTAQLRAGKTSLDKVTADVRFGDELDVLKREGNWVEVKTSGGQRGWIFGGKLSRTKPAAGEGDLAALGKSFRQKEASTVTASAGSRGLDKVSEGYAKQAGITKDVQDAVDRMAAYRITDQEVEDFLRNGRLGEYAQ
jgi:uncharacterized protein YgiM (DUF1202 family)